MKDTKLPPEWLPDIADLCIQRGLALHGTPFSLGAVELLDPWVDEFKIGSYEILWLKLIEACAKTGKPLTLSMGNATQSEMGAAMSTAVGEYMGAWREKLIVYHCVSKYPAVSSECDMEIMKRLKMRWGLYRSGWSDHTTDPGVILAAVALGADRIEMHIDLDDMQGAESSHGHCWHPESAHNVIRMARSMEAAYKPNRGTVQPDRLMERTDPTDGKRPLVVARTGG